MQTYHDLHTTHLTSECALTIGNFDGVHRGHQALLTAMVASARAAGRLSGVLTFDPHPSAVLRADQPRLYLTTLSERIRLLGNLGLDFVVVHPFTRQTAQTPAREFANSLREHLGLRELWVGPDFAVGRHREGNTDTLNKIGQELSFDLREVAPYVWNGVEVHSGSVRDSLLKGDVAAAADLLGRPYSLPGHVEKGDRRGRTLGFPTANLVVATDRVVPGNGIYAAWANVEGQRWMAATSIGVRPTFGQEGHRTIEAFLLEYEGDLYGREMTLEFVARLRDEHRFSAEDALIAQMEQDVLQTRQNLRETADFYEELEHTADVAFRVRGCDLAELFGHAGQAIFAMMGADLNAPAFSSHDLDLSDMDAEALLVRWLNALLYLQETHGELLTRYTIHHITPTELRARAYGAPGNPTRTRIKAVTFHGLSISQTPSGLEAAIVCDV